ncbi:hypothetical protein CCYA_CCYA14G3843 [Cyanidiococcus yangmingshanensis]|nr:hypothetical protein CCYA_CCYA14G3843 [Cyanidiococcus yangmingshanensis]
MRVLGSLFASKQSRWLPGAAATWTQKGRYSYPLPRLQRGLAFSYPSPRELNQVVHLDKFARQAPADCVTIWSLHHNQKPNMLGGALSESEFVTFAQRAAKYPWFVFPLLQSPEGDSFVSLLCQVQDARYVMFTYLQEYRQQLATAQPRIIFTVYDELLAEKRLALVRLENLHESQLKKSDLWRLWCQWRYLYTAERGEGLQLLEDFNERPRSFAFERVLDLGRRLYSARE